MPRATVGQVATAVEGMPGGASTRVRWVQIVMGESSGNTRARNGTHHGWLQMSEQHAGVYPDDSPADPAQYARWLWAPLNSLRAGAAIYEDRGFQPWVASAANQLLWLPAARAAVQRSIVGQGEPLPSWWAEENASTIAETVGGLSASGLPGGLDDALGSITDPVEQVAAQLGRGVQAIADAGAWLTDRDNWLRIALVGAGGAVVVVSAAVLARPVIESTVDTVK